jgi:hypothetical protein
MFIFDVHPGFLPEAFKMEGIGAFEKIPIAHLEITGFYRGQRDDIGVDLPHLQKEHRCADQDGQKNPRQKQPYDQFFVDMLIHLIPVRAAHP